MEEKYKDHFALRHRNVGCCTKLCGDICLHIIEVNEKGKNKFNNNAERELHTAVEETIREIMQQLSGGYMNVSLNISANYCEVNINTEITNDNIDEWVNEITGGRTILDYKLMLDEKNGKDNAIVFAFNHVARSYAFSTSAKKNNYDEFSVIFREFTKQTILHEVLHQFGAIDYYYPDAVKEKAKAYFPESVMLSISHCKIDSLTAYLIGWTEELFEKPEKFLAETSGITTEDVEKEISRINEYEKSKKRTQNQYFDDEYKGEKVNGKRHGMGTMIYPDGSIYRGQWKNDRRDGYGIYESAYETYMGQWKNDEKHGDGMCMMKGSYMCSGKWSRGRPHGKAILRWSCGDVYDGEWVDGTRCGKGVYVFACGDTYQGEFVDDRFCGEGVMTYRDGTVKSGIWKNDNIIEREDDL